MSYKYSLFMLRNKPTNNMSIVSILYIPQKINEIEILHKNATDILIVYSFKDLLLSKSPNPWVCQFSVGSLEKNIHGHGIPIVKLLGLLDNNRDNLT